MSLLVTCYITYIIYYIIIIIILSSRYDERIIREFKIHRNNQHLHCIINIYYVY